MRNLRNVAGMAILVVGLFTTGCASTGSRLETSDVGFQTNQTKEAHNRVLSRRDLDHVIDSRLSRQETVTYLKHIAIEDYDIQDPKTNWSHASIGNADSIYSVYYLTYRQRYFIFLLVDAGDRFSNCLDAVTGPIASSRYEMGMGPVEINHDHRDGRVVVIFNKKWKGNYSDDIIAAFKPNLEAKKIEIFSYSYIRIFREGGAAE
jgi:hypothetical protein